MFSDSNTEVTGFDSCPESERLVSDSSSQAADIHTEAKATQTTGSSSSAVQTTPDTSTFLHSYDADKLLKFLRRVTPHLEEELKTFDNLNISKEMNEDNEALEEAPRQTIIQLDFSKDNIISSLSWNSTRMMLAVGCAQEIHDGWCCHETSVGLYNTGKAQFEKQPEKVLRVSGCVKCLQFHGRIPSLLAAGLHSGELIIWDLKHDEEVFVVTNKKGIGDEPSHSDAITTITWRECESGTQLVTAGRDGKIIVWKVNLTNLTHEILERHIILKLHLIAGTPTTEHLDILQTDFLPTGPNFIAAASGGAVFYCSLTAARTLTDHSYKDPVLRSYKPRKGVVTSVSCGPELFASGGTDFEIHIFKYEQVSPILRIHTSYAVFGVWWNAPRSLIYWGESKVDRHDINSNKIVSVCETSGISTAAFKTGSTRARLAVGDKTGAVRIVFIGAN